MKVTFEKTNQRRYLVHIQRDRAPALWTYGPGYDDELPHDLLHFVAEAELGLDGAIFGDVAAGGNAKSFQPVDKALVAKMWRQKRMRRYVLPEGTRSERLAGLLEDARKAHRMRRPLPADWNDRLAAAGVGDAEVQALVPKLEDLARQWRKLPPGGRITLEWPRPEGRKRHPARKRRPPATARR
jgi:hypothetical protein